MAAVKGPNHHGRLLSGLQDLYSCEMLTDITIVAGNVEVSCHRCVLASCSPYFRAMFSCGLKEKNDNRVELHNIAEEILQSLIDYIYYAAIDINEATVQNLFSAAHHLEMLELCDLCAQFMMKELHVSNCVGMFTLGLTYSNDCLKTAAKTYILKNFDKLINMGDIDVLELEDFVNILSEDDLDIKSEEVVFNAVLKWVENDLTARKCHLPSLLKTVRLGLLGEEFMNDVVQACDIIMSDPFCRSMIRLARLQVVAGGSIGFSAETDDDGESENKLTMKRFGMHCKNLVTFIGAGQTKEKKGLGCFDPEEMKNYYAIPPQMGFDFTHRVDYHRAVVTEANQIFVAGGVPFMNYQVSDGGEACEDLLAFNPETKSWDTKAPMNEKRCAHGLVTIDKYIYAVGGQSFFPSGPLLSSVEVYDIEHDTWSYTTELPEGRCQFQAIVYDSKILAIGGNVPGGDVTNTIVQFDPETTEWVTFPIKLEHPRAVFSSTLKGDELIIVGGTNGVTKLNMVEIINLDSLRHCRGGDFPEDRTSSAMFVFNGEVYLCGGIRTLMMRSKQTKEMTSRDLWKYDWNENTWLQVAKLVPYANAHACVIAEHNIKKLVESEFISKK